MAQPNANSSFQITLINNDTKKSYMKKDILGKGSFGIVFRGSYRDEEIAVKRLELERLDPDDREIKLQIELEHDNVLKILSVDEDEDYKYIFLELCAGTLSEVINNKYKGPSLPTDQQVMYQIADGLDYIHSKNVIHRDIKPENILISMAGQMKLSDFGLSKHISTGSTYCFSGLKGTLLWMAPELRSKNESARVLAQMSDIFPCGCVFFVFLTREKGGIHPFGDTEDHIKIQNNIRKGNLTNFHELNSDHFASPVIRKMIDRDPFKRIFAKEVKNSLSNNNCATEGKISSDLIKGSFKAKMHSLKELKIIDARCGDFHPTAPILAIDLYNRPVLLLEGSNHFDSTIKWEDQGRRTVLRGSEGYKVVSIKWNTNGTKLATGCYKDVVSIWSYPSCALLAQFFTDFTYPKMLWNPFNNDVLAAHQTQFRGYRVILISCSNFRTSLIEFKSSSSICCLDWISENKFACGFEDGSIEIHEILFKATLTRLDKRFQHNGKVWSIAWNEYSKQLAACSGDGFIQIWSCDSETPVAYGRAECCENDEYPNCRSLSWYPIGKCAVGGTDAASNKLIVCGLSSQEIVVWFPFKSEQNPTRCLGGHSKKVLQVLFSPNGQFLASNGYKGEVIVWYTEDWQKICTLPGDFWINSWNATSCKLVISDQMSQSGKKDVKVIEIGTDVKSEISAGRGRKRKNSELNGNA